MKKYDIQTPPNEAGLTFLDYLRLISRKYHHVKNIILTFTQHKDEQYLEDLHAELNLCAWWGYAEGLTPKEVFRLTDRRFYALLRHCVGLRKVQIYENGHYKHYWVPEIELETQKEV